VDSVQRIPPSALSRKVTSAPRFCESSGRTQVSRVAIWRPQAAHCSGSCLTVWYQRLRQPASDRADRPFSGGAGVGYAGSFIRPSEKNPSTHSGE
jgi:hypothetical protein